jgi:hypothetical protein
VVSLQVAAARWTRTHNSEVDSVSLPSGKRQHLSAAAAVPQPIDSAKELISQVKLMFVPHSGGMRGIG